MKILKLVFKGWNEDKVSMWSAAVAYYTIFSLAPLFLVLIAIAGFIYGETTIQDELITQIRLLIGREGAGFVENILKKSSDTSSNIISSVIGTGTLLLGATGVFGQLQAALDSIFGIGASKGSGVWNFIKDKLISFSMLLGIAFLLIVSLVSSTLIAVFTTFFKSYLPLPGFILEIINFIISFFILTLLFALLYKFLPSKHLPFKSLLRGSFVTSLLFTIGKTLLGIYIGRSAFTDTYGAAGAFAVILVWIYYACQIFFIGAEYIKAEITVKKTVKKESYIFS